MKIVSFTGGLGNQVFEYLFYLKLHRRYPRVLGYYRQSRLRDHNGLEVQRWFEVTLPESSVMGNLVAFLYKACMKWRLIHETSEETYTDGRRGVFFEGFWQGRQYYDERDVAQLRFRPVALNERNSALMERVRQNGSVAVHVRRGDYLKNPHLRDVLGSVCTEEYYRKAIQEIRRVEPSPVFYVFSDDIPWCRQHFGGLGSVEFVDWNRGEDSFYDLYLMAHCQHHVIANSTFSYWSARLADRDGQTVYPSRWMRGWDAPDIFPEDWTGIYV